MDLYSLMAYLEELKKRQGQRLQVPMSSGGVPMAYGNGFDADGAQYDMATALKRRMTPDNTGHWSSRDPISGMILKGRAHPTWSLTEQGERDAGYEITKRDGRYYSQKPGFMYGNVPGINGALPQRQEIRMPMPNTLTHTAIRG